MAKFHFVEDYERHVADLLQQYPVDEAMRLAVGGDYDEVGRTECAIMEHAGLLDGHALLDFGCGSGRLATRVALRREVAYTGVDVVEALLDYSRSRTPAHYVYHKIDGLRLPLDDASCDFASAFSVFTHLLHAESYLYMEEIHRCLRPGGKLVLSFLEFRLAMHWDVFSATVEQQRHSTTPHLNQFMERGQIDAFAGHLGFEVEGYVDGHDAPWPEEGPGSGPGRPLGQSVAILRKPAAAPVTDAAPDAA